MPARVSTVIFFIIISAIMLMSGCKGKRIAETEPNDSFDRANQIEVSKPVRGGMHIPEDRDIFAVTAEKESVLSVKLSGLKGVNLAIKVWSGDPKPVLIKQVDDARRSSPEILSNLNVGAGRFYVEITNGMKDPKSASPADSYYEFTVELREPAGGESEPNDIPEQATLITPGNEITGYFSPAFNYISESGHGERLVEYDWYKIEIEPLRGVPVILDVNISRVPGINSSISLYDTKLKLIRQADRNKTGEPESITGIGITEPGAYYIRCESVGFTAEYETPYKLTASVSEYDSGRELEPNDDIESANPLSGTEIKGSFSSGKDTDIYLFRYNSSAAFFSIKVVPSGGINPYIQILNSSGKKTVEIDNAETGVAEIYPNYHASDDFYITVRTKGYSAGSGADYTLFIEKNETTDLIDIEPNNSKSAAVPLRGASTFSGFTSFKGDNDYYSLEFEGREKVEIEARGGKSSHIKVSVTDPMGFTIKSVESVKGKPAVLTETIDKTGYLIIETITPDYENPYRISFRR